MRFSLMVLPTLTAAGCAAWRVWRRHRVNSTAELLGAISWGAAAGAVVVVAQHLVLHAWANIWGAA